MRDTAARVAGGDPANIQAAGRLTERLADQVIADPSEALLLTTVKAYDEYTCYHMVNVGILCLAIGQAIGLARDKVVALGMGGLLHDVGKIRVPREILNQVGPLSEEQWRIIHRHPVEGVGLLVSSARDLAHPAIPMILGFDPRYQPVAVAEPDEFDDEAVAREPVAQMEAPPPPAGIFDFEAPERIARAA